MTDLNVSINYLPNDMDLLFIVFNYVEIIHMWLWDIIFFHEIIVGKEIYKIITLTINPITIQPLRRVFYEYFKYVLFFVKVISKSRIFFANYLGIDSEVCMFT